MATKTAFGHPEERLLDHEMDSAKKRQSSSGRGRASYPESWTMRMVLCLNGGIGHEPGIVHGQAFRGIGFDFEEGSAFGC